MDKYYNNNLKSLCKFLRRGRLSKKSLQKTIKYHEKLLNIIKKSNIKMFRHIIDDLVFCKLFNKKEWNNLLNIVYSSDKYAIEGEKVEENKYVIICVLWHILYFMNDMCDSSTIQLYIFDCRYSENYYRNDFFQEWYSIYNKIK
jgi:hypothetical protein